MQKLLVLEMLEGASQTYDTPSLQLQQLAGFLLSFISYFLSQNRELIPSSHQSKDRLWQKTRCGRGWWRERKKIENENDRK